MTKKFDYILIFVTVCLVSFGVTMVFSASPGLGLSVGDAFYYVKRHLFYLFIGLGAFWFALKSNLQNWKRWSFFIFAASLVSLLLVLIPHIGLELNGSKRWIDLGFFTIQPSEIAKFAVILFLATILSNEKVKLGDFWRWFFPLLCVVLLVAGLIMLEPDLGTSIIVVAIALIMFFIAGAKLTHLSALGGLGVLGVIGLSISKPYRVRRLLAYFDPWKDSQGMGYHIIQSLLAVGAGGLSGLGLGASKQKFFYLPQQFTDFIFAILCEELGFIGGVGVIVLFIIFALRGLRIATSAPDKFSYLLAVGLVSWLTFQALINIMVVVGLIPTTGIPLPFISYGGSATIVSLFSVGIILNISLLPRKGG